MIIAYHIIFTTYGTWLPNDPRGSYSKEVYDSELRSLGDLRYGRQDPPPQPNILRRFWTASRDKLARPAFFIDDSKRESIACGFARVVERLDLTVRACAIMNDHIHLLTSRSRQRIEYVIGQFKGAGTRAMGLSQTPWTKGAWKVFISDFETLAAAARYIEMNPIKAGFQPQHWSFVTPLSPTDF
ncbi:MAG: hypothetical protein HN350_09480 [Phycisphaerales bacterium]|jgi:REP element-mobilizing transposase RayT|nr:hypothetical protein [Phycisphaerales bacterium]